MKIDCEEKFGISSGIFAFYNKESIKISTADVLDPSEISKKLNPILFPKFDQSDSSIFEGSDNKLKIIIATRKTKNFEKNPTLLQIRKTKVYLNLKVDYQLLHYNCDEVENSGDCEKFMAGNKWITIIVVYKGKFQQYLGTDFRAADIALFAKDVLYSMKNLRQVTSQNFDKVIGSGNKNFFVDFYSPSCSPCRSFMKIVRDASKEFGAYEGNERVHFASVDCSLALNVNLCNKYGVRSWPSGKFFKQGNLDVKNVVDFDQHHTIEGVREFIEEAFNPSMTQLTPESFKELVQKREIGISWMVKFGTRTCGPCRQIEQQMKILARKMNSGGAGKFMKIGVIDCNDHYKKG